jgi:DNA polymerase III sliding clamp (beta) subunit (PCNA family)
MELLLVDLTNALRRVAPFVEKSSKLVISTNENGMELQCDNEYTGSGAYDFIQKLDSTGECVKFAVDAQLLMSGLKILPAMNVMVKAQDERHPILIVPSDGDEADEITVLLMPMRIESD